MLRPAPAPLKLGAPPVEPRTGALRPPPMSHRATPLRAAFVAALLALGSEACRTAPPPHAPPEKELSAEELRNLLAKGTIKPVTEMEGEDPFHGLESGMDEPGIPAKPPGVAGEPGAQPAPDTAPS